MNLQTALAITSVVFLILVTIIVYLVKKSRNLANQVDLMAYTLEDKAQAKFKHWRENELELNKKEISNLAIRSAEVSLRQWKNEQEYSIRQDAISRSQSVIIGKAAEHLLPYMPIFSYNPKEVRFIGGSLPSSRRKAIQANLNPFNRPIFRPWYQFADLEI